MLGPIKVESVFAVSAITVSQTTSRQRRQIRCHRGNQRDPDQGDDIDHEERVAKQRGVCRPRPCGFGGGPSLTVDIAAIGDARSAPASTSTGPMRLPGARTTSRRPTSPKDSVAAPNSSPPVGSASGATSVNAEMTIDAIRRPPIRAE